VSVRFPSIFFRPSSRIDLEAADEPVLVDEPHGVVAGFVEEQVELGGGVG
jgi:hypothetical protein